MLSNITITYFLSTMECMSSHSSKWRKEQPFVQIHISFNRMLTKYESNLQSQQKWMHEFTQQQVEKKKTDLFLITHLVLESKYESNLQTEYKWIQEFTQQQVEKRSIINFLITYLLFDCYPNKKVTYRLSTSECMSSRSK